MRCVVERQRDSADHLYRVCSYSQQAIPVGEIWIGFEINNSTFYEWFEFSKWKLKGDFLRVTHLTIIGDIELEQIGFDKHQNCEVRKQAEKKSEGRKEVAEKIATNKQRLILKFEQEKAKIEQAMVDFNQRMAQLDAQIEQGRKEQAEVECELFALDDEEDE